MLVMVTGCHKAVDLGRRLQAIEGEGDTPDAAAADGPEQADAGAPDAPCECMCFAAEGGDPLVNVDPVILPAGPTCADTEAELNGRRTPPCQGITEQAIKDHPDANPRDFSCPTGIYCQDGRWKCDRPLCTEADDKTCREFYQDPNAYCCEGQGAPPEKWCCLVVRET
jgi:hypothetical protein